MQEMIFVSNATQQMFHFLAHNRNYCGYTVSIKTQVIANLKKGKGEGKREDTLRRKTIAF